MTRSRAGNTILEFSLVAIPVLFMQFSLVEMCRGMWNYHSLAEAVQSAARVASVRGAGCAGRACALTVAAVARLVAEHGIGLPADLLDVTLTSQAGAVHCHPLQSCLGNASVWPPAAANAAGMDIVIAGSYEFRSAICMFAPGAGGSQAPAITLKVSSRETIVF